MRLPGGSRLQYDTESTVPLPYDIAPWKLEFELERLAGIRDVSVSYDNTTVAADLWSVTFLAYPGALPHNLVVVGTDLKGVGLKTATCHTPGSAVSTPSGITCPTDAATAQAGTAPGLYSFSENSFASFGVNVHDKHTWIIAGLTSGQVYNVRVSAYNSRGYSVPSVPVSEAPRAVPDAPAMATLRLVASSSTSLKTYWKMPPNDQGAVTTHYKVEWDTDSAFNGTAFKSYEDSEGNFDSHLLAPDNYEYTITGLTKGTPYYVRIRARNEMGYSVPRPTTTITPTSTETTSEIPRRQPDEIVYGGVTLATMPADSTATVADSSSNLLVSWEQSPDDHGSKVTAYRLEWWNVAGAHEVQKIKISAAGSITGTFTVSFDGQSTDNLLWNIDATGMTAALDTLTTVQHVEVSRSLLVDFGYEWSVTFMSDTGDLSHVVAVDAAGLVGTSVTSTGTAEMSAGTNYANHGTYVLDNLEALTPPYRYTITGLTAGTKYFARVAPLNDRGHGRFMTSLPVSVAPPQQKPDLPVAVQIAVHSANIAQRHLGAPGLGRRRDDHQLQDRVGPFEHVQLGCRRHGPARVGRLPRLTWRLHPAALLAHNREPHARPGVLRAHLRIQ